VESVRRVVIGDWACVNHTTSLIAPASMRVPRRIHADRPCIFGIGNCALIAAIDEMIGECSKVIHDRVAEWAAAKLFHGRGAYMEECPHIDALQRHAREV
jgi:hypothetical protein